MFCSFFFFLLFSLSISFHYLMNLASLARRPQTTSPFLPSAPLFPPSRRHHQSRKMASVTAYIEEKDLAAKVRNEALFTRPRRREKERGSRRPRNKRQPRKRRERERKRSNFSGAPCASLLGSRRPPLAHFDRRITTRGARRKRAPQKRAMPEKRSKPFFLCVFFFRPQVEQRRCLLLLERKKVLVARGPLLTHSLFTKPPLLCLEQQVEAAVNEAVRARPDEPLSFLVSFFFERR